MSQVKFVAKDTTTQGRWVGKYGNTANWLCGMNPNNFSALTLTEVFQGQQQWNYQAMPTDPRTLSGIEDVWYGIQPFSATLSFVSSVTTQLAIYCCDYDRQNRSQRIDVLDSTGKVLDTQTISGFGDGVWLVWAIQGNVTLRFTALAGPNAVCSAFCYDPTSVVFPPVTPPTFQYTTNIIGNSGGVTADATYTDTSPDGKTLLNDSYDESGRCIQVLQNGKVLGTNLQLKGLTPGRGACITNKYIYVPCYWPFHMPSPNLAWWGVMRLNAADASFAPFPGGLSDFGAFYKVADIDLTKTPNPNPVNNPVEVIESDDVSVAIYLNDGHVIMCSVPSMTTVMMVKTIGLQGGGLAGGTLTLVSNRTQLDTLVQTISPAGIAGPQAFCLGSETVPTFSADGLSLYGPSSVHAYDSIAGTSREIMPTMDTALHPDDGILRLAAAKTCVRVVNGKQYLALICGAGVTAICKDTGAGLYAPNAVLSPSGKPFATSFKGWDQWPVGGPSGAWTWHDVSGDGIIHAVDIAPDATINGPVWTSTVDANLGVWRCIEKDGGGAIVYHKATIDASGNISYPSYVVYPAPAPFVGSGVNAERAIYEPATNTLWVCGVTKANPVPGFGAGFAGHTLCRYDNWMQYGGTVSPAPAITIQMQAGAMPVGGYPNNVKAIDISARYIYAVLLYQDKIYVYDKKTGAHIGDIIPPAGIGAADLPAGISAQTMSDGTDRVVIVNSVGPFCYMFTVAK